MADHLTSANFSFLAAHDAQLVRLGALAELFFKDDAVTSLIKLRQYGETLAQLVAAKSGLYQDAREPQVDLLRRLMLSKVIPSEIGDLFHYLRLSGNEAIHRNEGDYAEALTGLKFARQLGIWFHRTFGPGKSFRPGAFVPPPDPTMATQAMTVELAELRAALDEHRTASEKAHALAEENKRAILSAEELARKERDDREVWEQIAAEAETAKAALAIQLQKLQEAAARTPPQQLVAGVAAKAEAAAAEIDIEAASRALIDEQLRARGSSSRAKYTLTVGIEEIGTYGWDTAEHYAQALDAAGAKDIKIYGPASKWNADLAKKHPLYAEVGVLRHWPYAVPRQNRLRILKGIGEALLNDLAYRKSHPSTPAASSIPSSPGDIEATSRDLIDEQLCNRGSVRAARYSLTVGTKEIGSYGWDKAEHYAQALDAAGAKDIKIYGPAQKYDANRKKEDPLRCPVGTMRYWPFAVPRQNRLRILKGIGEALLNELAYCKDCTSTPMQPSTPELDSGVADTYREVATRLLENRGKGTDWGEISQLDGNPCSKKLANKFLLCCLLDYQINSDLAWSNGYRLVGDILGDPNDIWCAITSVSESEWRSKKAKYNLHWLTTAHNRLWRIGRRICTEYDGDARWIWKGKDVQAALETLRELGAGDQISRMVVGALRDCGQLNGASSDVKGDGYVCRVVGRALVGMPIDPELAVQLARLMHPSDPWQLDAQLWHIGNRFCWKNNPNCSQCYLAPHCSYARR